MAGLDELRRRLRVLFGRERFDRELDEEMQFHLELQAEENRERGLDAEEARYASRRRFGNPTLLREQSREAWGWRWFDRLRQDLRYGLRTLKREPGFAGAAVLTIALGAGLNIAVFSLLYTVVLRPLPYRDPGRLAALALSAPGHSPEESPPWSYPEFAALEGAGSAFESVTAFAARDFTVSGGAYPERVSGEWVSASYFSVFGAQAAIGRVFQPEERGPEAAPVAVISAGLWRRMFGSDPAVPGKTIRLNEVPFTIVGVLPEGFQGDSGRAEIFTPLAMVAQLLSPTLLGSHGVHWLRVVARLKPGVTLAQAAADASHSSTRRQAAAVALGESKSDPTIRASLAVLSGAVAFLLLIACLNLSNLLLGRAIKRRREIAVRLAIGASRGRIIRQLLTESLLLSLAGGLAGLCLASWTMRLLAFLQPAAGGRSFWAAYARTITAESFRTGGFSIAIALLVAVAAGLMFGLAPALESSRLNLAGGGRGVLALSKKRGPLRGALMIAQLAFSVVLLAGAVLMLRSFARLLAADLGAETRHIVTMQITVPFRRYPGESTVRFFEELKQRVARLPGVEAAAVSDSLPVSGYSMRTRATPEGELEGQQAAIHEVGPEYFHVFRIPVLRGRALSAYDRRGTPRVAVLSETAARRLFPGRDPIGRRLALSLGDWAEPRGRPEIVGIAGNVRYFVEEPPGLDVYVCNLQTANIMSLLSLRTAGDPAALFDAVRAEVLAMDREIPVHDLKTMEQRVWRATSRARFSTVLLAIFAGLALALAAIGVYGVFSHAVAARTPEIGLRLALGARAPDVLRLVLRDGLLICAGGLALGLPMALAAARVLSGMLYGIEPGDPASFVLVSLTLSAVATAACYIPARRATRINPVEALRHE